MVGRIKSACTKSIRRSGLASFAWQARFHDRVVRSARERQALRRYIAENPLKWHLDCNHPERQR